MQINLYVMAKAAAVSVDKVASDPRIMFPAALEALGEVPLTDALNYGVPAIFGAVHGAERVHENRLLGAAGGALGGMGGSHFGGAIGRNMSSNSPGLGEIIGRVIGSLAGQDLGARAVRLAVASPRSIDAGSP